MMALALWFEDRANTYCFEQAITPQWLIDVQKPLLAEITYSPKAFMEWGCDRIGRVGVYNMANLPLSKPKQAQGLPAMRVVGQEGGLQGFFILL